MNSKMLSNHNSSNNILNHFPECLMRNISAGMSSDATSLISTRQKGEQIKQILCPGYQFSTYFHTLTTRKRKKETPYCFF